MRRTCGGLVLCAGLLAAAAPAGAAGLPPAPAPSATGSAAITLFLELVVNELSSGEVTPVQLRDGNFYITADMLRELHVRTGAANGELVAVNLIDGVKVEYDSIGQRLKIIVPAEWLPSQQLGVGRLASQEKAVGSQGFLFNYDAYANNIGRNDAFFSLGTEQRLFGDWGLLSNTGVYHRSFANSESAYLRYDTRYTFSDTDRVRTITAGDLITGSLPWGSAVRIGGLQIARNFGVRPDLVPYPLPQFSGQAAVPSAVDLFINGHKAGSETVQPGPFTLNTQPFINGAGEASVVTTDALGRQVLTTVPFYVASTLLKTGTTDYSLAAGALRRNYGLKSFSYGRGVASGSYRLGVTDDLTLEGRAEMARGLVLAGGGAVGKLGNLGVLNGSLAESRSSTQNGRQVSAGYQYNAPSFSIGLQHTLRNAGYADLSTLDSSISHLSPRSTQITASTSLKDGSGLSAGYFNVLSADRVRTRLATVSYSRPLTDSSFLSVNFNKTIGRPDYSVQLQLTLLFEAAGTVSLTTTRDHNGDGHQVQYSRSPPPDGGLGWNVGYGDNGSAGTFSQASTTWRGDVVQAQAGVFRQGTQSSTWAAATGSVVVMDGGVFAANRINDAFAVVSTAGIGNVPVMLENQIIGRTDAGGHLLVTGVTSYYPARFGIEVLDLPDFMQATQPEQRIVLRAGSGALLRFDIEKVIAASITLVDERGKPLPVGLQVQHVQSGRSAVVGWDGLVYLEGLQRDNELLVRGSGFAGCRVRFSVDTAIPQVFKIGPLTCATLPSAASIMRARPAPPTQISSTGNMP